MTIDQAIAILEAERVLQMVGCDGPDSVKGTAWYDYAQEAGRVIKSDRLWCKEFNDLYLLRDASGGPWTTPTTTPTPIGHGPRAKGQGPRAKGHGPRVSERSARAARNFLGIFPKFT